MTPKGAVSRGRFRSGTNPRIKNNLGSNRALIPVLVRYIIVGNSISVEEFESVRNVTAR